MDLDYTAFRFWFDVFLAVLFAGNWVYTWLTNRHRVNKTEIQEVRQELVKVVSRIDIVEERMNGAPTHTDLSNIYNRMNGMSENISEMTGSLKAMTAQLSLINDYLLRGDKR